MSLLICLKYDVQTMKKHVEVYWRKGWVQDKETMVFSLTVYVLILIEWMIESASSLMLLMLKMILHCDCLML